MFWGGEKERRKKTERGEGHFIAGHSSPGHVYLIRRGTRKNTPSFLLGGHPSKAPSAANWARLSPSSLAGLLDTTWPENWARSCGEEALKCCRISMD